MRFAKQLALITLIAACGGSKPATVAAPPGGGDVTTPTPPQPPEQPAATRPRAAETPAVLATPLPNDPVKATIHRLSNGMTVYISPDKQEPSVVAHVVVRAGSRHDPKDSTGLAHYLEHMLFKGTTKLGALDHAKEQVHLAKIADLYKQLRAPNADRAGILAQIDAENLRAAEFAVPNELDQLYARMGITGLNAFTANDATVYISTVPKNRLAQWARVEATRYADPVFRLFWPELEAVYEEKNRSLDNPAWRIDETMMRALFPNHGYGTSSGIGEIEHLKNPAYQDMEAFFRRYYTPQNMAIVLAGDVDASVVPLLEKEFGAFKRPAGEAVDPGSITPLGKKIVREVKVPSQEGVQLAWQFVPATHPDRIALEVMDLLLLDGTSGILQRDLLLTQKVADAGSNPTFEREAGWFELYANTLAGQSRDEAEKLLLGLIDKLQRGTFTDADLATAVLHYEISLQRRLESNFGRANLMEDAFIKGQDWRDVVAKVDHMRKVTKADVMRVAKQYLGPHYVRIDKVKGNVAPPKIDKPKITAVKLDPSRQSAFAKAVLDMPVQPIEPIALKEGTDYERTTLPTGPLVAAKNDRNQLFSVGYDYQYGRADDKLACLALTVLKVSGAGKRNPEELARHLHELGIVVETSCGKDEASINVSGIDKNFETGIALLREWLAEPVFDDKILEAAVATAKTERANIKGSPQAVAQAAQQFARYGKDSDFLVGATNAQLEAAKPAQIKKLLARFLAMKHRTTYFGPRAATAVAKPIQLGTGKLAMRAQRPVRHRPQRSLFVVDQDTTQTHVWMVWPRRGAANDSDRAVGTLFRAYAPDILYQEVREARGLAYSVFGGFDAGARKIDDASLYAYVGTQGDKAHDALDALLEVLGKPIDDNRLAVAKQSLEQSHRVERIPPRFVPSVIYAWLDQGEKTDPRAERTKRALAVDKAKLATWAKKALAQPKIVSITGRRAKLDEKKLKALAPVTVVPKDKLFAY